jgi:hypothetical protein
VIPREELALQVPQFRAWLDAELADQDLPCLPVHRERFARPAAAGECQHQHAVQLLA